jgi:hypothetical protein
MKGFLIFLAIAFPVVLASPFFWSLVNMNFGAQRIGYIHKDAHGGRVTQWATLGPKAPWPGWALVPAGANLTVRSNFDAAPGYNATGVGDIAAKASPRATAEHYETALRQAGWTVRIGRFDAASPDIPPRPIHRCIVEGRRGSRVQRMSVDIAEADTVGSLNWTEGTMPFPIGAKDEACWG